MHMIFHHAKIFPHSHQQLHGLLAANGDRARNLLVTSDREGAHGVAGLSVDGHLTGKLLQHLNPGHPKCRLRSTIATERL